MRVVVTGVAGFIGSTLADQLLDEGHEVVGIDCLTTYYDVELKRSNLAPLRARPGFQWVDADLTQADLERLFTDCSVIYHLAGQPGVRSSWRDQFAVYTRHNVVATQRVLEAALRVGGIRVVYASSSSVYGNATEYPCQESRVPQPHSPYGVTKLAAEHLAVLYAKNFGLPTVSLRYFTVYGPRQRPEMAMAQMIGAALEGEVFEMFAARGAVRDFTYVGDIARGTYLAGVVKGIEPGLVLNLCGGEPTTVERVVDLVQDLCDAPLEIARAAAAAGDVVRTGGDSSLAEAWLGWKPTTSLRDGISAQIEHHRQRQLALADQAAWARDIA